MKSRPVVKKFLLILSFLVIVCAWVGFDVLFVPRVIEGPMVQRVTSDGLTLVFKVHPDTPVHVVFNKEHVCPAPVTAGRCIARVEGIAEGSSCSYQIRTEGGRILFSGSARTAPRRDQAFRILVFGDSGDGRWPQRWLSRRMPEYTPDLILHTGDLIYPRGEAEGYALRFYQPYARLLASTPFYPCLGNHDIRTEAGRALLDNFVLPENAPSPEMMEREYWFDFGGARCVALDSNQSEEHLEQVTAPWLNETLRTAENRWKIVFFHEPVYTNGRYPPAEHMLRAIVPVLDRNRVELVLNGHNHMYERTHPIRAGEPDPAGEGTVYVTSGGGGARLYDIPASRPAELAVQSNASQSFTIIEVAPDRLVVRQIDIDGVLIDSFMIPRPPSSAPSRATGVHEQPAE